MVEPYAFVISKDPFTLYVNVGVCIFENNTVADPGFPRGGGANAQGGRQDMILLKFPENCMKLKKIRPPGGGRVPCAPLRSATVIEAMVSKNTNRDRVLYRFSASIPMSS